MTFFKKLILIIKVIIHELKQYLLGKKKKKITKTDGQISYSSTVAEVNFEPIRLRDRLNYMAENYPNKVAFVFHMNGGLQLTYSDLRDRSYLLARNFMSIGLKKADRIAFLLPNTHELLICYFASSLAGLISVPFDASYGLRQIDYMLKNTQPKAVVVYNCKEFQQLILQLFPEINSYALNEFKSEAYPSLRSIIVIDDHTNEVKTTFNSTWSYNDLASKLIDDDVKEFPYVDPDDIFAIISTSGTTSRPKGTIKTYSNFFKCLQVEKSINGELAIDLKICHTLLMYHMGAIYSILSTLFYTGFTLVFPSYNLDPVRAIEAIEKYKCDLIVTLPKNLANILDENKKRKSDLSSLSILGLGGQNVTANLIERARLEINSLSIFSIGYGSTECSTGSYCVGLLSFFSPKTYKSCVGQPYPFVECKIVNPDNGQIQPLNTVGELHVRSFGVTSGYWNDPEMTRKAIDQNGWFNTGDYLSMDEKGFLYFHSRSKEIISAKGGDRLDVFPSFVEACLLNHPNINEAVVFGIPISDFEQEICAWVKLKSNSETTVEEIVKHCEKSLLAFQVPRYIKLVDNFPVNQLGKYLRSEMSSQYKKELGI